MLRISDRVEGARVAPATPGPVDHLEDAGLQGRPASGRPNWMVQRPPTRRSQADSTTQSGASAYRSRCASGP